MSDKPKKSKANMSDRDRKFYDRCDRLISELCKICDEHRSGESLSRDVADPCADEYRDKLTANTAFYNAVDAIPPLREASETADMAYEICVMEHVGVGINDPPIDPPDMPAE